MVLPDGTLKLTDFGIAKATELDALTATNCTVGTAAYMSPEQCKGQSDLTHKSDLYSLGVLFYELVTGRKPFKADNAMDMFMQHVNGTFERPSRLVLDIPVWLDTLICQMLEKKPEQRPLDATMVANTLGTIQEKIESQQSAGVEAVRRRLLDRTTSQKRVEEEDKDAARVLMTGKGRAKRKRAKKPLYQKVWFQASGLALALALVATLLYLLFRPPSADKLYEEAKVVMESGDLDKQDKAIEPGGVITKCIKAYGTAKNERSREVRGWRIQIQVAQHERLLDNYMQKRNGPIKVQAQSDTEKQAFDAIEADEKGDHDAAIKHWQAVAKMEEVGSSWTWIADKHLAEWNALKQMNEEFSKMYDRIKRDGEEPAYANERQRLAFLAWRRALQDRGRRSRLGQIAAPITSGGCRQRRGRTESFVSLRGLEHQEIGRRGFRQGECQERGPPTPRHGARAVGTKENHPNQCPDCLPGCRGSVWSGSSFGRCCKGSQGNPSEDLAIITPTE